MYVLLKVETYNVSVLGPFYSKENALDWLEDAEPDNEQDELDTNRYLCYAHYYDLQEVKSPPE